MHVNNASAPMLYPLRILLATALPGGAASPPRPAAPPTQPPTPRLRPQAPHSHHERPRALRVLAGVLVRTVAASMMRSAVQSGPAFRLRVSLESPHCLSLTPSNLSLKSITAPPPPTTPGRLQPSVHLQHRPGGQGQPQRDQPPGARGALQVRRSAAGVPGARPRPLPFSSAAAAAAGGP